MLASLPAARPTMEGLEPVVFSALGVEVVRHGLAAGAWGGVVERDRMVDVSGPRGAIASGKRTRQTADPDPPLDGCRRLVIRGLRIRHARLGNQSQRGGFGQGADLLGVDDSVALEVAGLLA